MQGALERGLDIDTVEASLNLGSDVDMGAAPAQVEPRIAPVTVPDRARRPAKLGKAPKVRKVRNSKTGRALDDCWDDGARMQLGMLGVRYPSERD